MRINPIPNIEKFYDDHMSKENLILPLLTRVPLGCPKVVKMKSLVESSTSKQLVTYSRCGEVGGTIRWLDDYERYMFHFILVSLYLNVAFCPYLSLSSYFRLNKLYLLCKLLLVVVTFLVVPIIFYHCYQYYALQINFAAFLSYL